MSLAPGQTDEQDALDERVSGTAGLAEFVPAEVYPLHNPQTDLPRIAKDKKLIQLIDEAVRRIPTAHVLHLSDARAMMELPPASVHLVVTSPPYWTLKEYRDAEGQMGHIAAYEEFLVELDKVWSHCLRALAPGGRLICVVGDVCLSRRKNNGRHTVVPLHASIQEHCRKLGFDNLAPIIWHKISNAVYEVEGGPGFLGKPYEPNSVIKNDIEFILMQRKPGGYRAPDIPTRILSVISGENHKQWFQQIWSGVTGASTRNHPAPYPVDLAERGSYGCLASLEIQSWIPSLELVPPRSLPRRLDETASASKLTSTTSIWHTSGSRTKPPPCSVELSSRFER